MTQTPPSIRQLIEETAKRVAGTHSLSILIAELETLANQIREEDARIALGDGDDVTGIRSLIASNIRARQEK
jgi:hypothetical protein